MPLVRAYSRNLGQHLILARKGTFLKKGHQQLYPLPYSFPFLSVLHQNKALHNFHKREQCSIVERNTGLEYTLLVVLNSHISTTSHPLWKNANYSKIYVLAVSIMIMFLKVLKYFFSGKISFFLFTCLW